MGKRIVIEDLVKRSDHVAWLVSEEFGKLGEERLLKKHSPGAWSIIEVVEHLNRTFDHYFPKLEEAVEKAPAKKKEDYKRSFLVGIFSDLQKPKRGKRRMKMRTFEFFEPHVNGSSNQVMETFLQNQQRFDHFIKTGRTRDISKVKVVSALGPILKFRLPECFEFLLSHEERHLAQIREILKD